MGSLHTIFAFEFLVSYKRNLMLISKKRFACGSEMTDHREHPIIQTLWGLPLPRLPSTLSTVFPSLWFMPVPCFFSMDSEASIYVDESF